MNQDFNNNLANAEIEPSNKKSKRKTRLATIAGILVIIAMSIYGFKIIEDQKEEAAQKYITSISQKLIDNTAVKTNPAEKKDYGKLAPLVKIANEDVDKVISLDKSLKKELDSNMFKNNMSTNEFIGSPAAIEQSRKKISSLNSSLAKYEAGIKENRTNIDKKLGQYKGIDTEFEKKLINDYNALRKENYDKDMKELNSAKSLVAAMDKYLEFLQSKEGQYVISGGVINFYSESDVEECNKLAGNVTELSKQFKTE